MEILKKPVIVVDLTLEEFSEDRLFNPLFASGHHGISLWPIFSKIAEANNYSVCTLDSYIKSSSEFGQAFGISYEGKKETIVSFNKFNINCSLVFTGEPPNNARGFHININSKLKPFDNALLFSGIHKYCNSPSTKLHKFYWPNDRPIIKGEPWNKRRLLLMVASAKSNKPVNYLRFASRIIRYPRYLIRKVINRGYKILQFKDLYEDRLNLITSLAGSKDFFLFGFNWDLARKYDNEINKIVFFNEPIECNNKVIEISRSKFTICYENTSCPGYITEKIFDVMLSGSVPVYLGCPYISSEIPTNCFIDANSFLNPLELLELLTNMHLSEWQAYRQNIISYLYSDQFKRFTSESVSYQILKIITDGKVVRENN
jgi:hypothetical protein